MSTTGKLVPIWARGVTLALALANLAYGLLGYFNPGAMFVGLDLSTPAAQNAVFQFAARNTAIGMALVMVGLFGVPESIAIVMIIRLMIEAQDLVIGFVSSAPASKLVMAAVFMAVEAGVIFTMLRVIAKRDA